MKRILLFVASISLVFMLGQPHLINRLATAQQDSACQASSYLETTQSISVVSDYKIFALSRSSTDATLYMSVDEGDCLPITVDSSDWTWKTLDDGTVIENMTAGAHTFRIYSGDEQVDVDRLIVTNDMNCDPNTSEDFCIEETPTYQLQGIRQGELITENRAVFVTIDSPTTVVSSVTFYIDGATIGNAIDAPYCAVQGTGNTCGNVEIKNLSDGEHVFKTILVTETGLSIEKTVNFTVNKSVPVSPPQQPSSAKINPAIQVTGISEGATITGITTVSAALTNVNDDAVVRFSIDGELMNITSIKPYCMMGQAEGACRNWDTKSLTNGTHTLQITVSGSTINAKTIRMSFNVSNIAPVPIAPVKAPAIPIDGQPARASGTVQLSAPPAEKITNKTVTYEVDNKPVATTPNNTATIDTTKLSNGTHTVTSTVASVNGEKKTYQSNLDVNNNALTSSKSWMQRNALVASLLFVILAGILFAGITFGVRYLHNKRLEKEHNIYDSYEFVQPQETYSTYQQAGVAVVVALVIGAVPMFANGTSFAASGRGFMIEAETMSVNDEDNKIEVIHESDQDITYIRFSLPTTPPTTPEEPPTNPEEPPVNPEEPPTTPPTTPPASGNTILANPFVGGYIEMWGEVQPGNVPAEYDMLFHAFASVAYDGTATINSMSDPSAIKQQYATRRAEGKPTILSIGGYLGAQAGMTSDSQIQNFISSVTGIIDEYGFEGIDWDLEFDIPGGLSGTGMAEASRQLIARYGDDFLITAAPFEGIEEEYMVLARLLGSDLTAIGYQFYNMRSRVTADIIKNQIQNWISNADIDQNQFAIGFCQDPGGGQATVDESEMAQMYIEVSQTYPNLRGTWVWGIHYIDNVRGFRFAPAMAEVVR
jgi:hypothetical protein